MSIPSKQDGWVLMETGESGLIYTFIGIEDADPDDLPSEDVGTGSMAIRQDGKKFLFHEDAGWEELPGGGYPEPQGAISITQNGQGVNVKDYATANVAVPNSYEQSDEGKVVSQGALVAQTSQNITQNGTVDTTTKNEVVVDVPNSYTSQDEGKVVQSGALVSQSSQNITSNNTYDTTTKNEVVVNVANSYVAGDEGKVVSQGALVSQSSDTVTQNDTYDTTLINSLTVNVGGGTNKEGDILSGTLTGAYTNADATALRDRVFQDSYDITELHLSNCTTVGQYAAMMSNNSSKMAVLDFPKVTEIKKQGFYRCGKGLQSGNYLSVNMPLLAIINASGLAETPIKTIVLPACYDLRSNVFDSCSQLETVDLALSNAARSMVIYAECFKNCSNLTALIIRQEYSNMIPTLSNVSAFTGTPIASGTGYIYVPDAVKATYQAASNWSTYSAQFRSLESYTVDGTTTGALDPSKI